jgi:hypothetical protein
MARTSDGADCSRFPLASHTYVGGWGMWFGHSGVHSGEAPAAGGPQHDRVCVRDRFGAGG